MAANTLFAARQADAKVRLSSQVDGRYITRELINEVANGWEDEAALADVLEEQNPGLEGFADVLISAIKCSLPVVITVRVRGYRETFTGMVEYLAAGHPNATYVRIHSWGGFSTPYYFNGQVEAITTPERTCERIA